MGKYISLSDKLSYQIVYLLLRVYSVVRVRVGRRGVIVIPKEVREKLGLREGMVLDLSVEDNRIVIEVDDLWAKLRRRRLKLKGKLHVDSLEEELDRVEDEWLGRIE